MRKRIATLFGRCAEKGDDAKKTAIRQKQLAEFGTEGTDIFESVSALDAVIAMVPG